MKLFFRKNNGASLSVVLIIITVLMILGAAIISYAETSYRRNISIANVDRAVFSAEGASEICFDYFENRKSTITPIMASNEETFAQNFVQAMIDEMGTMYSKSSDGSKVIISYDVDGDGTEDKNAQIEVNMKAVDVRKGAGNTLDVLIGAWCKSSLKSGISNTEKEVYSQKLFNIPYFKRFTLNSAINTIGDAVVNGGQIPTSSVIVESDPSKYAFKVNINGNVVVYGSAPARWNEINQHFYGGISCQGNAYLNINGDAYSRSFVRTGKYLSGYYNQIQDRSRIDITGDVIAQCVQIFGCNDKIAIYKNAYTFDDLEVNGSDSVLAVNGNYFGLSRGNFYAHDHSSAIINSATVHDLDYDGSAQKSRIVVNGDTFVNGGTFKLDDSGEPLNQIEDSAVSWYKDSTNSMEAYRFFQNQENPIDTLDWSKYVASNPSYLKDIKDYVKGYQNLIQVFDNSKIVTTNNVNSWLEQIDQLRNNTDHSNNWSTIPNTLLSSKQKDSIITKAPLKLTGFCNYVLGANDKLYFKDESNENELTRGTSLIDWNAPNLVSITDSNNEEIGTADDQAIFNLDGVNISDSTKTWIEYTDTDFGIPAMLKNLNRYIRTSFSEKISEFFVSRSNLDESSSELDITHTVEGNPTGTGSYYDYLISRLKTLKFTDDNTIINPTSDADIPNDNKYYIIVIDDLSNAYTRDFIVKSNLNGIIVTKGKVKVLRGVSINGAIIAAGHNNGISFANINSDMTNNIPKIDNTNVERMNNADFAGIEFDGISVNSGDININFDGRETLINHFITQNPLYNELNNIL